MHKARPCCSASTGLAEGSHTNAFSSRTLPVHCLRFIVSHLAVSHPQTHHIEQQSSCARRLLVVAGQHYVFDPKHSPELLLQSDWSGMGTRLENGPWLKRGSFRGTGQAEVPDSAPWFSLEIPIPTFSEAPHPISFYRKEIHSSDSSKSF